jgi:hypothetical protein
MAKKQELEITVDDDGNVSIKVIGCTGPECVELTKEIEAALGIVTDKKKLGDFYVEPAKQADQVEGKQG